VLDSLTTSSSFSLAFTPVTRLNDRPVQSGHPVLYTLPFSTLHPCTPSTSSTCAPAGQIDTYAKRLAVFERVFRFWALSGGGSFIQGDDGLLLTDLDDTDASAQQLDSTHSHTGTIVYIEFACFAAPPPNSEHAAAHLDSVSSSGSPGKKPNDMRSGYPLQDQGKQSSPSKNEHKTDRVCYYTAFILLASLHALGLGRYTAIIEAL
jgi:hypothetical protein